MRSARALVLLLWLVLSAVAVAQDFATGTMIEGSLKIIRGDLLLLASEGARLRPGDIVMTSDSGFVQLEFAKGPIVALGPATQVYLLSRAISEATDIVMLNGWLKGESHAGAPSFRYNTPELSAMTSDGTVLIHEAGGSTAIFVESGSAKVGDSGARSSAAKAGQFFSRNGGKPVTTTARPDSAFIDGMPRAFRDTLPPRLARFSGKAPEPKREREVSYQDVQPWLTMNRAWRRGFVERFRPRLSDGTFRRAVDAHMSEHPEWDPVLHPEKYQEPKPAAAAEKNPGR
jgi:hypothetical protein